MKKKIINAIGCIIIIVSSMLIIDSYTRVVNFWEDLGSEKVGQQYLAILTKEDAEKVMHYHGILSMKWDRTKRDFTFKRNGQVCRAKAFEILKQMDKKK